MNRRQPATPKDIPATRPAHLFHSRSVQVWLTKEIENHPQPLEGIVIYSDSTMLILEDQQQYQWIPMSLVATMQTVSEEAPRDT